ncbi:hypothetical protein LTR86_002795 [Recurvomyces mirabilis]|nr:hypothetical protein LTR86_002795 [Recurvomyces mirabilis]
MGPIGLPSPGLQSAREVYLGVKDVAGFGTNQRECDQGSPTIPSVPASNVKDLRLHSPRMPLSALGEMLALFHGLQSLTVEGFSSPPPHRFTDASRPPTILQHVLCPEHPIRQFHAATPESLRSVQIRLLPSSYGNDAIDYSLKSKAVGSSRLDHTRIYLPEYITTPVSIPQGMGRLLCIALASLIGNHIPSTTVRLTIIDQGFDASIAAADIDGALVALLENELPLLETLDLSELSPPGVEIRALQATITYAKQHTIVVVMSEHMQQTEARASQLSRRSASIDLVCS